MSDSMNITEAKLKACIKEAIIELLIERRDLFTDILRDFSSPKPPIKLISTSEYPCTYDDLIDSKTRKTLFSVSTLNSLEEEDIDIKTGITHSDDGVYDIVIDTEILTEDIVKKHVAFRPDERITKAFRPDESHLHNLT